MKILKEMKKIKSTYIKNESEINQQDDNLNPLTLSFKSEKLERMFCEHIAMRSLKLIRLTLLLAIMIFLVFTFFDRMLVPGGSEALGLIRTAGIGFFTIMIGTTFIRSLQKYFQILMMIVMLIGGANIIAHVVVAQAEGVYFYYAGLILTIIYGHSLLRLRFIFATLTTWAVIAAYFAIIVFIIPTPREIIINNAFFLVSANLMGMFASYGIEYYMRTGFRNMMVLCEKTAELQTEYGRKSKELEAARNIQLSMLPDSLPEHPDVDISVTMKTASEIGGDYYDFTRDENNNLIFAVGDATGHGAQAGAMVTAIKILFSNYAARLSPEVFLEKANKSIKEVKLKNLYMAFAIGRISGNILEIAGVGIPPLLICKGSTGAIQKIRMNGLPLGSYTEFPYMKYTYKLEEGDSLLLMTDGLPELFNKDKEMFGYERVEEILFRNRHRDSKSLTAEYLKLVEQWTGSHNLTDDLTLLVIKVKSGRLIKELAYMNDYNNSLN